MADDTDSAFVSYQGSNFADNVIIVWSLVRHAHMLVLSGKHSVPQNVPKGGAGGGIVNDSAQWGG